MANLENVIKQCERQYKKDWYQSNKERISNKRKELYKNISDEQREKIRLQNLKSRLKKMYGSDDHEMNLYRYQLKKAEKKAIPFDNKTYQKRYYRKNKEQLRELRKKESKKYYEKHKNSILERKKNRYILSKKEKEFNQYLEEYSNV